MSLHVLKKLLKFILQLLNSTLRLYVWLVLFFIVKGRQEIITQNLSVKIQRMTNSGKGQI